MRNAAATVVVTVLSAVTIGSVVTSGACDGGTANTTTTHHNNNVSDGGHDDGEEGEGPSTPVSYGDMLKGAVLTYGNTGHADAGEGEGDGGSVVVAADAGTAVSDAGGGGIADAGSAVGDAGQDTSEGGVDAGGSVADAGAPLDAGVIVDAGSNSGVTDAGTSSGPSDAGTSSNGCVMAESSWPEEPTWHIDAGQEPAYAHNPPTSGPHWPYWARWATHDRDIPPEVYVHNEEHGGVVFLVGPAATPEQTQALKDIYNDMPIDPYCADQGYAHRRITEGRDPDLDDVFAIVAWNNVLEGSCLNEDQIRDFVLRMRGHGKEQNCWDSGF